MTTLRDHELTNYQLSPDYVAIARAAALECLARMKREHRETIVLSQDEFLIRRIAAQVGATGVTIMTGKDFARTE